ncbi:penicillin-binding transpeptidase domain-containing protein [Actinoalloteichus hymeniacidonis]|uniref:Cell division protein FtsI/penicillin-binding protein 2 n=1 Tax=Actinoalloteichus hymeniacidonis TaxID=340345 RepID=A0AAC9HSM5_9PSEU|nr:penicillin-binding transpeptidase domain-containing protein [Actinoalloteichus hymeniacidonis]AOS64917.1 cell division protein FtsI/penicillin-binding protein 2 [Actinoalloteichus hymeniacidonis]MBB5907008.1 cell division protein FtsI/penicillin-binding protein 2 [Actinoalloteichus hymeniacidonis]
MRVGRRSAVIAGVAILIGGGLAACSSGRSGAEAAAEEFAEAWQAGNLDGPAYLDHSGEEAQEWYNEIVDKVSGEVSQISVGEITIDDASAEARLDVSWDLGAGGQWEYESTLDLRQQGDDWRIALDVGAIHPDLVDGERLRTQTASAQRGEIVDLDGEPIVAARPVVVVGVQPSAVTDAVALADVLGAALAADGVDTGDLPDRIASADPESFVEVVTLREERYREIRDQIYEQPGTVFREETMELAPTREFARAFLGSAGPVTEEIMEDNPGRYRVGDIVGLSGLQRTLDERLRGTEGVTVLIDGTERELYSSEPVAGDTITLTLDAEVQNAADRALAAEPRLSALVAVRISDGNVLAVAGGPDGGYGDVALHGRVPPGSTFKMVSALALLEQGSVDIDQPVACPATIEVEGYTIKNAFPEPLGEVPFREDFARSCNTAFVALAPELGTDGLTRAAADLGIGGDWGVGIDVFTGSVPHTETASAQAASAFGQGETTVSPMTMAAATAGVAAGKWKQPRLVVEPDQPAVTEELGEPLDQEAVDGLHTMMREVVTDGTATRLAEVPGEPVHGKTGTAEYGTEDPPRSHSWFVGWQGDVALASFVEDGGDAGGPATAAAERFLRDLNEDD